LHLVHFIFMLTFAHNSSRIAGIMKSIKVKTAITKLYQRLGSDQAVADKLGISKRYVIYLRNGERKAGIFLARAIKEELNNGDKG